MRQDTVPRDELVVGPDGQVTFRGRPVSCIPDGRCVVYRARGVERAATGIQDVGLTAWGLGVEGLSATALLRGRTRLGGDFIWPRSGDEFDAILVYAQLDRGPLRVRAGRQETLSGLGFSGYDGLSVTYEPRRDLTVEAYGGRSLARALNEPRNEALEGLVDFLPDRDAWLMGAFVRGRLPEGTSLGLRYQREILSDRSGLVSERASLDVRSNVLRPVRLNGSLDYDVAFDRIGKAHVTAELVDPGRSLLLEVTGRRYVPYFELSTIWGFFSPVAYHEVLGRVSWTLDRTVLWAGGGWRSYQETHAPVIFEPLQDDGWRVQAGTTFRPDRRWTLEGRYELEWGVGAFLSAADATVRYRPREELEVAAHGSVFQRFEEFRVGEGRTWGGGLSAALELSDRFRLDGGLSVFRHDPDGRQVDERWNQTRAWTALRVEFGDDPGRPGGRFRR